MSDAAPGALSPRRTHGGVSVARLGVIAIVLAFAAGATYYYFLTTQGERTVPPVDTVRTMRGFLANLSRQQKLSDRYSDTDGDLLADPPTDKAKWIDPQEIWFTAVATDEPGESEKTWQPLIDHLSKTTGRKVIYRKAPPGAEDEAWSPETQLLAVRDGRLHVTAFNTGQVPAAVTTAGFHPLFAPATADGTISAYQMEIMVPAGSPIKRPEDLRGKRVALVALSSNSGGKAPLALLKEKGLAPGTDYEIAFTGDHHRSAAELVHKKHDAACVANDLLGQDVAEGKLNKEQYRTIYTSPPFPPLAFGVPHNLAPELRKNVEQAFETFSFIGNSVGEKYKPQGRTRFTRIDYRKDYAVVREIDARLLTLLEGIEK
jgi:phosphonate transport system substrate-binding protein